MTKHTLKFRTSETLLNQLEINFPDDFDDWKITIIFYICLQKMKALSVKRNKNIGDNHKEIAVNINPANPNAIMPIKTSIFQNYQDLRVLSQIARYDPIIDEVYYIRKQKENLIDAKALLLKMNLYFKSNSIF